MTGQTTQGKSAVVSDQNVGAVMVRALPGAEFYRLWGSDEPVQLPTAGQAPSAPNYLPPPNGFRFVVVKLGPDPESRPEQTDMRATVAEMQEKLPGLLAVMEPQNPGMHTSDTIDFGVVLSGEVWLELDDGVEIHLATGDSMILNGVRHAWRNKSSRPCVLVFGAVGAARMS